MTTVNLTMGEGIDRPYATKKLPEPIPYLDKPLQATWKALINGERHELPCLVLRILGDEYVTIRLPSGAEFSAHKREVVVHVSA